MSYRPLRSRPRGVHERRERRQPVQADRFVVSAPVTGSLARLALEPGDTVNEGDALAEIAPATSPLLDERTRAEAEARLGAALSSLGQARAQVSRAKVAQDLAEQELARSERLAKNGTIPSQALEQADFAVRMRVEELSSATFGAKVAEEHGGRNRARPSGGRGGRGASRGSRERWRPRRRAVSEAERARRLSAVHER